MTIPSYDDLTPSIPDVKPGEVFTSVAAVLPKERDSGLGARGSGLGTGKDDEAAVSSNRPEAGLRVGVPASAGRYRQSASYGEVAP